MIFGSPALFAVESQASMFYERVSLRALGFFNIHVGGVRYGVHKPDATMLANSLDEVGRRIKERGSHTCLFATERDAGSIAHAVSQVLFEEFPEQIQFFGLSGDDFHKSLTAADLLWAPDGDAAFDDGSYVLQFDVLNRVRLVAFKRRPSSSSHYESLRDIWVDGVDFYDILQEWHSAFLTEWASAITSLKQTSFPQTG